MLDRAIATEIWLILAALAGVVLWCALTGRMNLRGLLTGRPGGAISPARAQMLVATFGALLSYLIDIGNLPAGATSLPPVSDTVLLALGGSHVVHLASLWAGRGGLAALFAAKS